MDSLVYEQGYPIPDLIKMDVQAAETAVLRGAERLIREARPNFLISIHTADEARSVCRILLTANYSLTIASTRKRITTVDQAAEINVEETLVALR